MQHTRRMQVHNATHDCCNCTYFCCYTIYTQLDCGGFHTSKRQHHQPSSQWSRDCPSVEVIVPAWTRKISSPSSLATAVAHPPRNGWPSWSRTMEPWLPTCEVFIHRWKELDLYICILSPEMGIQTWTGGPIYIQWLQWLDVQLQQFQE